jgi:energy-coupling factor transport system ATP-binding protein
LKQINLNVYRGEFIALIGQNGAGKTTFTKHMNALLRPTQGDIWVDGMNTRQYRTSQLAHKVGYVFQNPDHQIFSESVWEEVAFGPKRLGVQGEELEQVVVASLERLELLPQKDAHPYILSKGQRQRVAVASIVAMKPDILVIDEPTTGQDYKQSQEIMSLFVDLNQEGKTILVVTHDMRLVAKYASRTVVMGLGQILLDAPTAEVFQQIDVLRSTHLRPPQITNLGFKLGLNEIVLSIPQMVQILTRE